MTRISTTLRTLAFTASLSLLAPLATAQAASSHAEALARLDPLVGAFTFSGTRNEVDGSVTTLVPTRAVGEASVNGVGRTLGFVTDAGAGAPITNRIDLSHDRFRDLYRVTVLDDASGLLDVYEGGLADGVLSVTNLRSDTFYPVGDLEVHFRLVWDLSDPVVEFTMDATTDRGAVWQPFMATVLTPLAETAPEVATNAD